jgi:acyl carrier protein
VAELETAMLEVVSEKTGYPTDMLELEMDMEADLGIDSIKRVEILGEMQTRYPDLPNLAPEELAELRTLGEITDHLRSALSKNGASASPSSVSAEKNGHQPELPPAPQNVERHEVRLKTLPLPDFLEVGLPQGHICLISDDGSALTAHLADSLSQRHWPVVVLTLPQVTVNRTEPLPASVTQIRLATLSESSLPQELERITQEHGPIGTFIHLHPHQAESAFNGHSDSEKALLKHVFLFAKHLKTPLTTASQHGRSSFVTVTRLDGAFGLAGQNSFDPLAGGLNGLTKSLNLEWPTVYCRAIDLSPTLTGQQAAHCVVAELHDPNQRLLEVAYSSQGRVTLVSEVA